MQPVERGQNMSLHAYLLVCASRNIERINNKRNSIKIIAFNGWVGNEVDRKRVGAALFAVSPAV